MESSIDPRRLHDVIQATMSWTQSHLYLFESDRLEYGESENGLPIRGARATRLRRISPEAAARFLYHCDFGDSWWHQIAVEKVLRPDRGVTYPRCPGGRRACPPEDCGGIGGCQQLPNALHDPEHEEHQVSLVCSTRRRSTARLSTSS